MSLTYRILLHIAKTKNESKFFLGGQGAGVGAHGGPGLKRWRED